MESKRVTLTAFGLTDVGRKRRLNEDAYLMDIERGLFVVADGMGGHAAGEVASRITVESIQEFIAGTEDEHENTWPFGFNNRYSLEGNRLTTAVEKANEKVMRAVQNRPELKGMGTTVVAALFDERRATLVHVGDSRAYLLREGELKRLTDDHSWVQEQVNAGILSEEEAKTHPLKNVVTRALGGAAHVAVDLIEIPSTDGDRYLLCSDGLTGMVTDEEIFDHLRAPVSIDRTVRALIDLANERGGIDNITTIVIEVRSDGAERRVEEPATSPALVPPISVQPHDEVPTLPGVVKPDLDLDPPTQPNAVAELLSAAEVVRPDGPGDGVSSAAPIVRPDGPGDGASSAAPIIRPDGPGDGASVTAAPDAAGKMGGTGVAPAADAAGAAEPPKPGA